MRRPDANLEEKREPRVTGKPTRSTRRSGRVLTLAAIEKRSLGRSAWGSGTGLHAPYVWTGCRSQVRGCCRKSLICIRPGDRLAGRGLDGSTHAPLISLPARLPGSRLGHQIRDASINPFHATPQSRTRFRWRPRSPRPQAGYRTLSRCAGRSRQFARACSPTRRRVCSCAIAATPF